MTKEEFDALSAKVNALSEDVSRSKRLAPLLPMP